MRGGMTRVAWQPSVATAAAEREGFRLQVEKEEKKLARQRDVAHERSAGFAGVTSTPRSSGSSPRGEDDSKTGIDSLDELEIKRSHSDGGFERVDSGSRCFGGMEKLHRNAPSHLKQMVAREFGH